jgi:monoamine oxidase
VEVLAHDRVILGLELAGLRAALEALPQAYRYSVDSRDEDFAERLSIIGSSHSCWH